MKIYVYHNGEQMLDFNSPSAPRVGDLLRYHMSTYAVTEVVWCPSSGTDTLENVTITVVERQ